MATFNLNQNDINFNSVSEINSNPASLPYGPSPYESASEQQSSKKLMNAVDIDWNEANLSSRVSSLNAPEGISHSTITTTGELLDEIAHLRAQVDALTSLVKGLYNALA